MYSAGEVGFHCLKFSTDQRFAVINVQIARGANGRVASGHPLAAQDTVRVLQDGDFAVDASLAGALGSADMA